jgi:5'-nucleotidase
MLRPTSSADGKPLFAPSVVRDRRRRAHRLHRRGHEDHALIVVPSGVAGLRFTDEADAINRRGARLQAQGIKALVAVIHEGGNTGTPGQPLEWNDAGCPNPRGAIFDIVRRWTRDRSRVLGPHPPGLPLRDRRPRGDAGHRAGPRRQRGRPGDRPRHRRHRPRRTQHRNLPVFNAGSDATLRDASSPPNPSPSPAR